jgi:hypothetical protein
MPQVLVGGVPKQQAAVSEQDGELKIGDIGAAVVAAQPVLLLGEVVVANAGAVQLAQDRLGGAEIGRVAVRLGEMERYAFDPAAHQDAASGQAERWRHPQRSRGRQRAALAAEQMVRHHKAPPRDLVDAPQHGLDLAGLGAEAAALHR